MEYLLFLVFVGLLSPWIAAVSRNHPQHGWILAFVLLLGWTGIGWALAWLWALSHDERGRRANRNVKLRVIDGGAPAATPPAPAHPPSEMAHP